ncbi:MAG: beta-N-acetylhexosaminidase [Xanthomonadaceae bacterium]|nr:beta-N-acetylhexosaminidase [Xanthomonadaceae bacterium]
MSLGPVMLDVAGTALSEAERELLRRPAVGGVILFSRNFVSPEQVAALVTDIHALRTPRLLVAVDQEGGRVQRFRDGFTRLPPARRLGELFDQDPRRARQLAEVSGWLMAAELRAIGIDISFAPVLDLDYGVSTVIGDRAFHRKPEVVAELAQAYQRGMGEAGMAATGKHFPGHGAVVADSHHELPIDERPFAELEFDDLLPFERLAHQGMKAMMAAHVIYRDCDSRAAGFSPFWLRTVLRERLGFQGAIFSDDLNMKAAACAGDYPARARTALGAGCDMVLVCNAPEQARQVVESLRDYHDPAAMMRLARLHGSGEERGLPALRASEEWRIAVAAVQSCDPEPMLDMDL